jgi:phosphomevalonate kinase
VTSRATASAPGKVVLSGEYAVLDGAPAICMAVDRRAGAIVEDSANPFSEVRAPGFSNVVGRFRILDDGVEWVAGQDVFEIVDAVMQVGNLGSGSSLHITLDTEAFIDPASRSKIGIGSSAALTVALSAAVAGSGDVQQAACRAHTILQRGAGSGVDIACSLNGGLIGFRMNDDVTKLEWPQGLQFRLIWTGVASSTTDKLALFNTSPEHASRSALAAASRSMAAAWAGGSADEIVGTYAAYIDKLQAFSVDHALGIFDAGHDRLVDDARTANLVYKPCGAGGGDVGILLGSDRAALDAFVADLPADFRLVDCELDLNGTKLEKNARQ